MIGLDTNVLLRWLIDDSMVPDDAPHQSDLVSRAINDGKHTCFANVVVIAETMWVVAGPLKQSRDIQAEIIERLLISYNAEVSDRQVIERALAAFREGKGGFVDHLIGEMNHAAGCSTTLTFDKAASKSPRFSELN